MTSPSTLRDADAARVLALLRERIAAAGSLRAWAGAQSLSHAYVRDVLLGSRQPGPRILAAIGYERVVSLQPVGGRP